MNSMNSIDSIDWINTFMLLSVIISKRSKDPNTQVGATIVYKKKVIGLGYNGFPIINNKNKNNDDVYTWSKNKHEDNKYLYVVHAELNAIFNSSHIPNYSTLYTTLFPCNECTKAIIQNKIKKIYYLDEKNINSITHIASKKMLDNAGVKYIKINIQNKNIFQDKYYIKNNNKHIMYKMRIIILFIFLIYIYIFNLYF